MQSNCQVVEAIAFSPDGKLLASVSAEHTIHFWDVVSGQTVKTIRSDINPFNSIAFAPNGKTLASSSKHGVIRIWDLTKLN